MRKLLLAALIPLLALALASAEEDSHPEGPPPSGGPNATAAVPRARLSADVLGAAIDHAAPDISGRERARLERNVLDAAAHIPENPAQIPEFLHSQPPQVQDVLNRAIGEIMPRPPTPEHGGDAHGPGSGAGGQPTIGGGQGGAGPAGQPGPIGPDGTRLPPGWPFREAFARYHSQAHPDDPEARADYGAVLFYSGNDQSAFQNLGRAIELGSRDPQAIATYGRAAYALGDYHLAAQSGDTALRIDPANTDAEALTKLAEGRVSKVSLPSALAAVGLVDSSGQVSLPADLQGNAAKAIAAAGLGGDGAASPRGGSSAVYAGNGGGQASAAEIAAAAARQAQTPPSNVEQSAAVTHEAASALTVKDYDAAHELATKAITLNPRNAQAWNYRAIADNKLSRFNDAVYDSSFALGLVPGNAPALQSRSWAFSKQQMYKEALADANYTLEKEPENAFAYQNRAFALAGMGDRDAAMESLKRSAELDPRFQGKLEQALQAPEKGDLLFLFDDAPASKDISSAGGGNRRRFLQLILWSLSGGVLVALGLLNIVSAGWRDKMQNTIRRVLGSSPQPLAGLPSKPAGEFWSQYELVRTVGSGGMGVVYEAVDRSLNRRVAVKKMRDEIRLDPGERQRFVAEARTVAALHHPNIVDIYAIVEDDQDVYLVFEYVAGQTLAERLKDRGPLEYETARRMFREACDAVEYAHRRKVIHRDVKPSNIMVGEEDRVKVMDFGVARQAQEAVTKLTMTNTIVGTPPYMAPEQEQGSVRPESDVFALGVCLYEMLSGKLPFAGQGAGMLLNKINGKHLPISSQTRQKLPPGIDDVLAKALNADPDKRYKSPALFGAAVEGLAAARLG